MEDKSAGEALVEQPVTESELEIVTVKIVLPLIRAKRASAAAFINETEGSEESEEAEGFGSLAEVEELETGGSEEPLGPGRAELGTEHRSCRK
jgi:hypothetical protein